MASYKELMMSRGAFIHLRARIEALLISDPVEDTDTSTEFDHDTGDMLVTAQYKGVEHTHRIIIKDENATPALPSVIEPPDGMPYMVIAMLQATIEEAWQQYGGDPTNSEQFWNHLVGNGASDVSRGTSREGS